MARWFWFFIFYSFFGYLLEKAYARWTKAERQVRKCFLLLPLCPVYGLAMCAVLALTPAAAGFWATAVWGGLICTGMEYLVHLLYDRAFHVRFWDYSGERGNLAGRVCPQFALVWGLLAALALRWIQPILEKAALSLAPAVTFTMWILLAADCVLTFALLGRYHDTEMLTLEAVLGQMRASSQSSTSR